MSNEPTHIDRAQAVYGGDWERPSFRELQEKIDHRDEIILTLAIFLTASMTINLILLLNSL